MVIIMKYVKKDRIDCDSKSSRKDFFTFFTFTLRKGFCHHWVHKKGRLYPISQMLVGLPQTKQIRVLSLPIASVMSAKLFLELE